MTRWYCPGSRIGKGGMAELLLAVQHGPWGFRKLVVLKRLREGARQCGSQHAARGGSPGWGR